MDRKILTIVDANANRLTEGLRVCEDITRFVLRSEAKTKRFKSLRHRAAAALRGLDKNSKVLSYYRKPEEDVGIATTPQESKRKNIADIFRANIKRAEESARVLEEFSKLVNTASSRRFKKMRFELYSLEKDIVEKL